MWQLRIAIELLLAWLARLRNKDALVPVIIAFTIFCWLKNLPRDVWVVMQSLRLIYSKDWCKDFLIEMDKQQPGPDYPVSTVAHSEAADNNYVLIKIAMARQRVDAEYRNVHMIQRVQYACRRTAASEAI